MSCLSREFFVGPKTVKSVGESIAPRVEGRSVQLYCLTETVFADIKFRHDTATETTYAMTIAQGMVIPEVTSAFVTTGNVLVLYT